MGRRINRCSSWPAPTVLEASATFLNWVGLPIEVDVGYRIAECCATDPWFERLPPIFTSRFGCGSLSRQPILDGRIPRSCQGSVIVRGCENDFDHPQGRIGPSK